MRRPGWLAALIALAAFTAQPARANILITVDKSAQQMTVNVDGDPRYIWPVSTGMSQYDTPGGQYTPFRMEKDHFSREWDDAPMPYSIFFTKQGHAIHGTNHKIDGEAHSHGCVRLSVQHAAILWGLVKAEGMQNVRVELSGQIPTRNELIARREPGSALDKSDPRADDPVYRYGDRDRDMVRGTDPIYRDERAYGDDDDLPPSLPPQRGVWREYREGGRVYYYREGPDEERRLPVRRRPHYYRHFGGFPFW